MTSTIPVIAAVTPPVKPLSKPTSKIDSTPKVEGNRVILRNYSKGIFSYPILIYSFIAWIIEFIYEKDTPNAEPYAVLAAIWLIFLFGNIFMLAFDITTGKFLVLVLGVIAIVLILVILGMTGQINFLQIDMSILESFHPRVNAQFYIYSTVVFGLIVLLSIIQAFFQYVKIEQNEVYVIGISGTAKRYSTAGMTFKKEIADVFEFLALRAGSLKLTFDKGETIILDTILNIQKKEKQLDRLLSTTLMKNIN